MTYQSDFNLWVASNYYRNAINIISRFTDKGVEESLAARLSCTWHLKYNYGINAPKDDEYFNGNQIGRTSVDALIASPEFNPAGDVLWNCWVDYKRKLDARRSGGPVIVIEPPPPEPPKPVPVPPEAPKSQSKEVQQPVEQKKVPWKLIATLAAGAAFALKFTPVPAVVVMIADWVAKILQAVAQ